MLRTHQLVCKCRTALRFFQQSLGLPSFHSASAFPSHDARRALRLACMKASLTPTCAGHIQAWNDWRSVSLLLQSSTAPEARPYQFHLLQLCQQMMDPRSHIVHWTLVKNHTRTTARFLGLLLNMTGDEENLKDCQESAFELPKDQYQYIPTHI